MTLYVERSKEQVIAEYTASSQAAEDHAKAKWGSEASMVNRFRLAHAVIDWKPVRTWLDLGCGVGRFFALVEGEGHRFDRLVGADITEAIVEQARWRRFASPVEFLAADLEALPTTVRRFDLVTLLGVLQQCGMPPARALAAVVRPLAPGGQLFLTTKNIGWNAFADGRIKPEANHSWFDLEELREIIASLGLTVVDAGGFLPAEGRRVPPEESHSVFIHARRAP